jgi:hypothetical protein
VEPPTVRHGSGGNDWRIATLHRRVNHPKDIMNTIIYIVGLVVIIGIILSYFGFR